MMRIKKRRRGKENICQDAQVYLVFNSGACNEHREKSTPK
jgi:hypothetical protein